MGLMCFTSKHVFLVNIDKTHTSVTYVSYCCRVNTLFTEYRETSLVWCHIVTHANAGNRLMIFPCSHSVNNIYLLHVLSLCSFYVHAMHRGLPCPAVWAKHRCFQAREHYRVHQGTGGALITSGPSLRSPDSHVRRRLEDCQFVSLETRLRFMLLCM